MGKQGISLIEVIISIGVIVMLFGGIYAGYVSIIDVITNSELRAAAAAVLHREIEIIRNLPYEQVGTVGGVPSGIISQTKTVSSTLIGVTFSIATTVRNIDDPFDGVVNGAPSDTAPADYKLVELRVSCLTCARFTPLSLTTTVAPKNLESASGQGSIFVSVFDASIAGVSGVSVHVVNASVTPSIDLTDTTNADGMLQLVGVPTSSQGYRIEVSKSDYSSDRTYPPGDPANPSPLVADATVAAQSLTEVTLFVDRVSTIYVHATDHVCVPAGGKSFSIAGAKLIGAAPDIVKFSTSTATNASGTKIMANMEYDTYSLSFTDSDDILGTIPLSPVVITPSSSVNFNFIVQPSSSASLLVTATGGGGTPLPSSTINLAKAGFSETKITGHSMLMETDWSGARYASQDGGVETEAVPGKITLKQTGGMYSTTTVSWLISNTIDLGGSTTTLYALSWNPANQPPSTGAGSLKFQFASNNDNATWNFVGSDGTANTYYTTSGSAISSVHANHRYVRYRAYLSTADENATPELQDMNIEFNGVCVPSSQSLFTNLAAGDYAVTVSRDGYATATSSVTVSNGWNQTQITLVPNP